MKYFILLPLSYLLGDLIKSTVSPFGFPFSPFVMVVATLLLLWSLGRR